MLAEGARVMVTGRDVERGEAAQAALGDRAMFVAADATDADDVRRTVGLVLARFRRLDTLVNAAPEVESS